MKTTITPKFVLTLSLVSFIATQLPAVSSAKNKVAKKHAAVAKTAAQQLSPAQIEAKVALFYALTKLNQQIEDSVAPTPEEMPSYTSNLSHDVQPLLQNYLDLGLNPNARDDKARSLLSLVSGLCSEEMVDLLIAKGAKLSNESAETSPALSITSKLLDSVRGHKYCTDSDEKQAAAEKIRRVVLNKCATPGQKIYANQSREMFNSLLSQSNNWICSFVIGDDILDKTSSESPYGGNVTTSPTLKLGFSFENTNIPVAKTMCKVERVDKNNQTSSASDDRSGYKECTSPVEINVATELNNGDETAAHGDYVFKYYAISTNGDLGQIYTYNWTFDSMPITRFDSRPDLFTSETSALFKMSSTNESNSKLKYLCSLDDSELKECSSTVTFSDLKNGFHSLQVSAVKKNGIKSLPMSYIWNVSK